MCIVQVLLQFPSWVILVGGMTWSYSFVQRCDARASDLLPALSARRGRQGSYRIYQVEGCCCCASCGQQYSFFSRLMVHMVFSRRNQPHGKEAVLRSIVMVYLTILWRPQVKLTPHSTAKEYGERITTMGLTRHRKGLAIFKEPMGRSNSGPGATGPNKICRQV